MQQNIVAKVVGYCLIGPVRSLCC